MTLTVLLWVFGGLSIGAAIGVVLSKSPVGSLLYMVACLAAVAGIYVLLEAHFLAAIQIIVYAGAIMVLFLFVIMLLNLGHDEKGDMRAAIVTLPSFALVGALGGSLFVRLNAEGPLEQGIGGQLIDASTAQMGAVGVIAEPLYTTYVVPFEITGILLLVAIVGALVLAKRNV